MSSSLTFSRNWRKHKVEQKALDLPEYTQFLANANSTSAKLEKNNNQVVQNWREQKVKQNVLDLPSGIVKSPQDIKHMDGLLCRSGKKL